MKNKLNGMDWLRYLLLMMLALMLTACVLPSTAVVSTLAGLRGVRDGPGNIALFYNPTDVAVDSSANLYVTDGNKIRKITPDGVVSTFAGTDQLGSTDGPGNTASFVYSSGVAVDSAGNVYVTDGNKIRKITPDGVVSTLAGAGQPGSTNGPGNTASFFEPGGVAVDSAGNVYVADTSNHMIRESTPDGVVSTLAGGMTGPVDGPGNIASFFAPSGVAMDLAGNAYVADRNNHKIRKITPDGVVSTFAGTGQQGSTNGPGNTASFSYPSGVAVDSAGNVYVSDGHDSINQIRKITPDGFVSTQAGTGQTGPTKGVAVDSAGNLYVPDGNLIRKITPDGVVSILAAMGPETTTSWFFIGTSLITQSHLDGITVDSAGNVYVIGSISNYTLITFQAYLGGPELSSATYQILKITPDGVVSPLAGSSVQLGGGVNGGLRDGPGNTAKFKAPQGLAVDNAGNVFVADTGNSRIRKIAPNGIVSTVAGTGQGFSDGQGILVSFNLPKGVAVDNAGNVFVADTGNNLIRKIVLQ